MHMNTNDIYILGVSAFYHDSAACVLRNGEILAAAQEERFTRKKHDAGFPVNAIDYCLEEVGIEAARLDHVVFYDKPILTFERLLFSYLSVAPRGLRSWLKSMPVWLGEKLHVPRVFRRTIGYNKETLYTEHHQAHAASAFYPSPYDRSAILTIDGVGEWATASYGFGKGNEITMLKELHFPDSVGMLYSAFTYFTGFKVNSGEYKLMGLAPYGEPKYKNLILNHLVDVKNDGSVRLDMSFFDFLGGLRMTNKKFSRLFDGPPRKPETPITRREMDLAASIQAVVEEVVLKMAIHVQRKTGEKNLCLAGGVALNCVANGRLLRGGIFDDIWIQPASGDAGGAVGSALAVWHQYLGKPRSDPKGMDSQKGSFLGPAFSSTAIEHYLAENKYPFHRLATAKRANVIADLIAQGNIVGYMTGRMEFGPRALGARSIMGDPRQSETQKVMNLKIKYRESFRPFAPSVLEDEAGRYFELDRPSPYMLLVAPVKKERQIPQSAETGMGLYDRVNLRRSDIPAVTHIDYSARVQTVNRKDKPDYYGVISEFERLTGCPVVVNTSFNVRGEPIVCNPEDAYRCFMRTEMDVLVMEDAVLYKTEQPAWAEKDTWQDEFVLD